MQIPIPSNAEAFNKVEKNVNLKSSKELQDDDKDTAGNEGHGVQMSSDVGQTRVGEDGGIDYNGFEEESEEETIELPKEEVTLDPKHVTDGEKEAHPIFFDYTSSAFTPERYLTIRNHIIQCWLKIKPGYLNKTSARNGLRNSCDVNQIGAIHQYLESIGAINFGATNPLEQSLRKRRSTLERWSHLQDSDAKTNRLESMRPRKQFYRKYSEGVEEGSGIEKPKKQKSKQTKAPAYDPFKLIECHRFSRVLPAPFIVKVKGDAIVIMDVHSHLSTTEVIGLLGGYFDPEQGVLDIKIARPCRSISTGMQCEMDPVSQTEACEEIQSSGCRVVGWYHSHPTFSPNPSVRDIETQGHFQDWFSQDTKSPFIGVIVSPYHTRQLVTSQINYLTVSQEWSPDHQCWRPYKFDFSVYQDRHVAYSHHHLLSTASNLITEFARYKYRVEMLWVCPGQSGITYLDKMIKSISTNLCGEEEAKEETLSKLKSMVYAQYNNPTVIKDSTIDPTLPYDPPP
nr:histone H2A deubiquitinase MYSM1-like [Lytechinus pictus]